MSSAVPSVASRLPRYGHARKRTAGEGGGREATGGEKVGSPRKTCQNALSGIPWFEVVAVVLTFACTHDCWDNPFLLDDLTKVRDNPDIRSLSLLPSTLVYPYSQMHGGAELSRRNDPSRPITFLSYALDYSLAGPEPRGFRIVNIALHLLNCIALRRLMRNLQSKVWREDPRTLVGVPEGASILWLVSPVNMQTAAYIYARSELLSTFFSLSSLLLACSPRKSFNVLVLHGLFYLLSLGSKQTAIVLPVCVVIVRILHGEAPLSIYSLQLNIVYLAITAAYCALRFQFLGGIGDLEGGRHIYPLAEYASAQPWVCLLYIKMLVTGTGQALDHSPDPDGLAAAVSTEATFALCVVSIPVVSYIVGMPGFPRVFWRLAMIAAAWWAMWLLPSSSVVPTVDLMVERRTYLASAAVYACLDASMLWALQHGLSSSFLRITASVGAAGVFIAQTWRRMYVMGSEDRAWRESASMYPRSARAHHNLGTILMSMMDGVESQSSAAASFKAVLSTNPADEYALNNLGSIHDMPGPLHDRDYAAMLFTKAIRSNPAFAPAHYNLGLNHHLRARVAVGASRPQATLGEEEDVQLLKAEECYAKASALDPRHAMARNNLGLIMLRRGRVKEAENHYLAGLESEPGNSLLASNLKLLQDREIKNAARE